MKTKSILLSGVGGQGTITAAKLLTTGLMEEGYDVKMSEIHGMSQRGGTVLSQVRFGDDVKSPVIEKGGADLIVAFEIMEAMRYIDYLKPEGRMVINDKIIWPLPVVIGKQKYPEGIVEALSDIGNVQVIDASGLAEELGNAKATNVILLGAIVRSMNLTDIDWERLIRTNIKPKFADLNVEAFRIGTQID